LFSTRVYMTASTTQHAEKQVVTITREPLDPCIHDGPSPCTRGSHIRSCPLKGLLFLPLPMQSLVGVIAWIHGAHELIRLHGICLKLARYQPRLPILQCMYCAAWHHTSCPLTFTQSRSERATLFLSSRRLTAWCDTRNTAIIDSLPT
jgi:hypothetical protein